MKDERENDDEGAGEECDNDVLDKPGVEKLFVAHCSSQAKTDLLDNFIYCIELSGCIASGSFYGHNYVGYSCHSMVEWGGHMVNFAIKYTTRQTLHGEEKGLAIVRFNLDEEEREDIVCWWALYSSNQPLPPLEGWVPEDPRSEDKPKIKYVLKKSFGEKWC